MWIPGKGEVEGDMLEIVHEVVDPLCSKRLSPLRWLSQLDLVFHLKSNHAFSTPYFPLFLAPCEGKNGTLC